MGLVLPRYTIEDVPSHHRRRSRSSARGRIRWLVMNLDARHATSAVAHDPSGYLGKDRSRSRDCGIDLADAATDHIDAVRGAVGVPIGCSSN
jgi:hypothetical protein